MSLSEIKTIIYASDLTGHGSRKAFRVAASHAVAHKAKLVFVNVVEPISTTAELAVRNYVSEDVLEEMKTDGVERIKGNISERIGNFCAEELPDGVKLPVEPEVIVEHGLPEEKIIELANTRNADMIVLGTRCHSRISQLVLGSTSHKVLYQASCPVLIVPID